MTDILAELNPIFQDVLDQPDLVITRASNASNVDDWDSLSHVNLITAIQQHFHVRFGLGELEDLKNVGDMVDLLARKLGGR
jgi:acyl carrier protein